MPEISIIVPVYNTETYLDRCIRSIITVQYYHDHRDLGLIGCAHNLGISQQTLSRWQKQLRDNGEMPYRGSGNYASDEAKEIARLKRELRDAKDAINILKKAISILDK